jgi:two-component system sensor histidine kinase BaeS
VLEKQESSRRNFMADVSHELRTPLAVLKGELEALQDGMRPLTPQTVQSLQAEVAILGKLVNDLHDLSLADVGGLAYRCGEMDLSKLAGDCLGAFRERFASRNLRVETQLREGVKVHADADRLAQIVNNLLENTVRYTDEGGRIVISLRAESGKAVLDLQDSAPGVPEESLPRIFERLYRVESSRNRERGGSGLGLSICRCVVEAHGGTIVARASSLGGLWIEVRLPLAKGAR